jgi:hypothetical protein
MSSSYTKILHLFYQIFHFHGALHLHERGFSRAGLSSTYHVSTGGAGSTVVTSSVNSSRLSTSSNTFNVTLGSMVGIGTDSDVTTSLFFFYREGGSFL